MEWISVEEKLPADCALVLVGLAKADRVFVGFRLLGRWYRYTGEIEPSLYCPEINPPSHWMPLPEPPEPLEQIASNAELQGQINRLWKELTALKQSLGAK
jgi:hypothetical protein